MEATIQEVPDETLMERYIDGDAASFEELFRRCEPSAYRYFLKRTHSRERAQDLYQELFLRIHRARDSYDSTRAFTPWFFQIAQRLWIDDQRRAWRSREVPIGDRDPPARRPDAADETAGRQQVDHVLAALSAQERYVLVSAKVEGVSYLELAGQLGKSVAAVKKLASRAMQRVRAAQSATVPASAPFQS
ncbi:MAG: RNA polymerase sigma factor [Myxococcota bacterium]